MPPKVPEMKRLPGKKDDDALFPGTRSSKKMAVGVPGTKPPQFRYMYVEGLLGWEGVQRIVTSNKKHFMKNVKECRDVIVKKVLEQGWDTRTTHYTHVGPMTPYIVVINYMTCIACLCKKQPDLL